MSQTQEETPAYKFGVELASILPEILESCPQPVNEAAFYRAELSPSLDQIEKILFEKYGKEQAVEKCFDGLIAPNRLARGYQAEIPDQKNTSELPSVCEALVQRNFSDSIVKRIEETLGSSSDSYEDYHGVWSLLKTLTGSCVTRKSFESDLDRINDISFPTPFDEAIRPTLLKIVCDGLGRDHGSFWAPGLARCLQTLFAAGDLTDEIWNKALALFTGSHAIQAHKLNCWDESQEGDGLLEGVTNPLYQKQQSWLSEKQRFVMEAIDQHFAEPTELKLKELSKDVWMADLRGGGWLVFGARMIEHFEVKRFTENYDDSASDSLPKLVDRFLGLHSFEDTDEFAEKLKAFKPATLELLRGKFKGDQLVFEKALGIDATPLALFQRRLRQESRKGLKPKANSWDSYFGNNDDPENGVLEPAELREAARDLKVAQIKKCITGFSMPGEHAVANAKFLFHAVFGINADKVEASLKRFGQPAAKALGLLPLPDKNPETEIEARYLKLLEFEKGCQKFGSERRANSKAAVQVGMENLARNAGYSDSTRLQWAIEARLAGGDKPGDATRSFETGDYRVTFLNDSMGPRIEITKNDKLLKSIPAPVKKTAEYKELKVHCDQAKKQYTRVRKRLEIMMIKGELLQATDLEVMSLLPGARELLKTLLLRASDGTYGFFDPEKSALRGLPGQDGKPSVIKVGKLFPLQIAHAIQLHQDRSLAPWQAEVFRNQIVQPFKQVFREIYLLTDAERKTATHSNRFGGRVLDAPIAGRLLSSRDWKTACEGETMVHRVFREEGIVAELKLAEYGHYFTEMGEVTTAAIQFTKTPPSPYDSNAPLELEDIDPQLYSEVLRDIDLAASVAYLGEEHWTSQSSLVLRKDLLQAMISDLAVEGVGIDGKYATVEGSRASYRVHLETGAIYIGTGNHICVVPEKSKAVPEEIYLPFAADEDFKLREIISRVLMLLNDHNIRDKEILSQINEALE